MVEIWQISLTEFSYYKKVPFKVPVQVELTDKNTAPVIFFICELLTSQIF